MLNFLLVLMGRFKLITYFLAYLDNIKVLMVVLKGSSFNDHWDYQVGPVQVGVGLVDSMCRKPYRACRVFWLLSDPG